MEFTYGTDPEFFLKDGDSFISAWGLFPGTKEKPFKLDRGALQVDGNALEFNVDPVYTEDEFVFNIKTVMDQIDEMIKNVSPSLKKVFQPVAKFDIDYWKTVSNEAKILGCSPDYTVDNNIKNGPNIFNKPVRTAAGHVHIGWRENDIMDKNHFLDCLKVARAFHSSGVFDPVTDAEKERLKYYGGNGAFRDTPFGVEIRSPSNIWVETEEGQRETFRKTQSVLKELVGA